MHAISGDENNAYRISVRKSDGKRPPENLRVNNRIILKSILYEQDWRA
jgi:hypothetical protein